MYASLSRSISTLRTLLLYQAECHAVEWRGAMLSYGCPVGGGGVALVDVPRIHGILLVGGRHEEVALGLGQH